MSGRASNENPTGAVGERGSWGRPVSASRRGVALTLVSLVLVSAMAVAGGGSASVRSSANLTLAAGPTYAVTFGEVGLPSGTNWSVVFNGVSSSSTGPSIGFSAPNGTYNFSVPHLLGRYPSPADGALSVQGGPVSQSINWSTNPEYNVTVTETGLPSGLEWVTVLAGTHHVSFSNTTVVLQGTGTYNWSVLSVAAPSADGSAGWAANPFAGILKVSGGPAWINVTFRPGWAVTISESGLPSKTPWKLGLNTSTRTSVNSQMTYILSNASYTFRVLSPLPGPTGVRYIPNVLTILEVVAGANLSAAVAYSTQYFLTTSASPPGGGTVAPASEWLNASASVVLTSAPGAQYAFVGWSGLGNGSYSGTNATQTISMAGPVEETAVFVGFFFVNFTATGLPSGLGWAVTLNGVYQSSTTAVVSFTETPGVYAYSIAPIPGFTVAPTHGNVSVTSGNVVVAVDWSAVTFPVTFTEVGLPSGTNWSVTAENQSEYSSGPTIVFAAPNGTLGYTVGPVPGFAPTVPAGSVTVNGAPQNLTVTFRAVNYTVTYAESGLPSGTSWSLTVGGVGRSTSGASVAYSLSNGTYAFRVGPVAGYFATPSGGNTTVAGSSVSVSIVFAPFAFGVSFTETGLPANTSWSVDVNQVRYSSTSPTISVSEPNGTYAFTVGNVSGFSSTPSSGNVTVNNRSVGMSVAFTAVSAAAAGLSPYLLYGAIAAVIVAAAALIVLASRRKPREQPPPSS